MSRKQYVNLWKLKMSLMIDKLKWEEYFSETVNKINKKLLDNLYEWENISSKIHAIINDVEKSKINPKWLVYWLMKRKRYEILLMNVDKLKLTEKDMKDIALKLIDSGDIYYLMEYFYKFEWFFDLEEVIDKLDSKQMGILNECVIRHNSIVTSAKNPEKIIFKMIDAWCINWMYLLKYLWKVNQNSIANKILNMADERMLEEFAWHLYEFYNLDQDIAYRLIDRWYRRNVVWELSIFNIDDYDTLAWKLSENDNLWNDIFKYTDYNTLIKFDENDNIQEIFKIPVSHDNRMRRNQYLLKYLIIYWKNKKGYIYKDILAEKYPKKEIKREILEDNSYIYETSYVPGSAWAMGERYNVTLKYTKQTVRIWYADGTDEIITIDHDGWDDLD